MIAAVNVTRHAVIRYRERVKPALELDQAHADLQLMLASFAVRVDERPVWCATNVTDVTAYWLIVDGAFCCPVELDEQGEGWVPTVLIPGTMSPERRVARTGSHRNRKQRAMATKLSNRSGVSRRARKERDRRRRRQESERQERAA
jgi:hypothetical protein